MTDSRFDPPGIGTRKAMLAAALLDHLAIFRALAARADGGTSPELAAALGWDTVTTSLRLGRLFRSAALQRDNITAAGAGAARYRYRLPAAGGRR